MPLNTGGGAENPISIAGKPWGPDHSAKPIAPAAAAAGAVNNHQAIAFVHENDIYYKPRVQQDLVCRITTTGKLFKKEKKRFFECSFTTICCFSFLLLGFYSRGVAFLGRRRRRMKRRRRNWKG